jgi:hypothetical protein
MARRHRSQGADTEYVPPQEPQESTVAGPHRGRRAGRGTTVPCQPRRATTRRGTAAQSTGEHIDITLSDENSTSSSQSSGPQDGARNLEPPVTSVVGALAVQPVQAPSSWGSGSRQRAHDIHHYFRRGIRGRSQTTCTVCE